MREYNDVLPHHVSASLFFVDDDDSENRGDNLTVYTRISDNVFLITGKMYISFGGSNESDMTSIHHRFQVVNVTDCIEGHYCSYEPTKRSRRISSL